MDWTLKHLITRPIARYVRLNDPPILRVVIQEEGLGMGDEADMLAYGFSIDNALQETQQEHSQE
jgi:hypothetical protein